MRRIALPLLLLVAACEPEEGLNRDLDGDGFVGDDDCDDNDASVHIGAPELCNGRDDDCDGTADEDSLQLYWVDSDGDGYGDIFNEQLACNPAGSVVGNALDCDDGDPSINPSQSETCNGVDDNCDDLVDNGVGPFWYEDSDQDGYGDPLDFQQACESPGSAYIADNSDCNDADVNISPSAPDCAAAADGVDDDCDGTPDNGAASTFYADSDGDGFGDPNNSVQACTAPSTHPVLQAGDCNDFDEEVSPDDVEICDGIDNDCNGLDDFGSPGTGGQETDGDSDGERICEGDCNDAEAAMRSTGDESTACADGLDNDCDGNVDAVDTDCPSGPGTWYFGAGFEGFADIGGHSLFGNGSAGKQNGYIARWDDDGSVPWANVIDSFSYTQVHAIAVSEAYDRVVATGTAHADFASTTVVFQSTDSNDVTLTLAQDHFFTVPDHAEAWVAAWNLDGEVQWVRRIGPANATTHLHQWIPAALDISTDSVVVYGTEVFDGDNSTGPQMDVYYGADQANSGGLLHDTNEDVRSAAWAFKFEPVTGTPMANTLMLARGGQDSQVLADATAAGVTHDAGEVAYGGRIMTGAETIFFGDGSTFDQLDSGGASVRGWVGKAGGTASMAPQWTYEIDSDGSLTDDAVQAVALAESSGDVLVLATVDGPNTTLYHGGGSDSLDTSSSSYPSGVLARYASDGNSVLWSRVIPTDDGMDWWGQACDLDDANDRLYVTLTGPGFATLGPGESNELTLPLQGDPHLAAYDAATGDFLWQIQLTSSRRAELRHVEADSNGTVRLFLRWDEDLSYLDTSASNQQLATFAGGMSGYGVLVVDSAGVHVSWDAIDTFSTPAVGTDVIAGESAL